MNTRSSPPPPLGRRPLYLTTTASDGDDITTEDDLTTDDWDDLLIVDRPGGSNTPRDPTRPSFDTSSLTAPPAPINHTPHQMNHRGHPHHIHHPNHDDRTFISSLSFHQEEDNEDADEQEHTHESSSSHHRRRHRWSDGIDPGVPPPHPVRSQRPLILPPPPPSLLNRRWSETSSSSSSTSSSSTGVEGYSLGAESSEQSQHGGIIAIGIPEVLSPLSPDDLPTTTTTTTTATTMTNLKNTSIHSTSLHSNTSSHQRREAALLHQADEDADDALRRMPWRRRDSSERLNYLPSDIEDGGIFAGEEDDTVNDLLFGDDTNVRHHIYDLDEKEDERLARHLAARELQEHTKTHMQLTTPIKSKIQLPLMQVTAIDTPNQRWWKWSPSPRSLWSKSTSRLWSSSTITSTGTMSQKDDLQQQQQQRSNFQSDLGMVQEQDSHHHRHAAAHPQEQQQEQVVYPAVMNMMMVDDMLVDLDSYPSGVMTADTHSTPNHPNHNHHPPPTIHHHNKNNTTTTGLRRIDDYDASSEQPPLPLTAALRKTSSSSSSSSSPWSFVRWQQKLHASLSSPERVKSDHHDAAASGGRGPQLASIAATSNTMAATAAVGPPARTASLRTPQPNSEKGPRLANPFAKAVSPSTPAIVASDIKTTSDVYLTDTDKRVSGGKDGPTLAAAVGERRPSLFSPIVVRRGQRRTNSSTSNLAATSSTRLRSLQLAATVSNDDDDDEEEVEAQAGIPILLPGAFAVDGIDTLTRRRSRNDPRSDEDDDDDDDLEEDNLLDDVSEERRLARQRSEQEEAAAAAAEPPLVLVTPIQAELHPDDDEDLVLAQGAVIVQAVNEEQEQAIQSKQKQRMRTMKWVVILLSMVALITVIIVVVVVRSTNQASKRSEVINTGPVGWSLVGAATSLVGPGDEDSENFGAAFATNANASRIIVGIPGWDQGTPENPLQLGQAQVYQQERPSRGNNATWTLQGTPWYGAEANERLGRAVAMSSDGRNVAVASEPKVSIYSLEMNATMATPTWKLVAQFLPNSTASGDASTTLSSFGDQQTSMAMSADGFFLVVGVPDAGDYSEGLVRVYAQIGSATWSQIGQDLVGNSTYAMFGTAVDIVVSRGSGSGTSVPRIAVGAPGYDESIGQVQTFVLQSNVWTLEQYFTGDNSGNNGNAKAVGQAVALSKDGLRLAIGASGASTSTGISVGQVQVYQFFATSGTAPWVPLGDALIGSNVLEQFGFSVALSSSGSVLAVGAPQAQDPTSGNQVGRVQVFQLNTGGDGGSGSSTVNSVSAARSASWSQVGGNIIGVDLGEDFGFAVALSADGKRVVGSAPGAPYDGGVRPSSGAMRVYNSTS